MHPALTWYNAQPKNIQSAIHAEYLQGIYYTLWEAIDSYFQGA